MADFQIVRTSDTFIIGKDGLPKKGKSIVIFLPEFDEQHIIEVEGFDPDVIEEEANALLEKRRKLADLGG